MISPGKIVILSQFSIGTICDFCLKSAWTNKWNCNFLKEISICTNGICNFLFLKTFSTTILRVFLSILFIIIFSGEWNIWKMKELLLSLLCRNWQGRGFIEKSFATHSIRSQVKSSVYPGNMTLIITILIVIIVIIVITIIIVNIRILFLITMLFLITIIMITTLPQLMYSTACSRKKK